MRIEAKKKLLAAAISDVQALTSAVGLVEGSSLVLSAEGKKLKVSSPYAEATVDEVIIKEKGTIVVDQMSLVQALKVSGETFKLSAEEGQSSAFFTCGRSKGPVSLRDADSAISALKNAPKARVHVPGLQPLLKSIALKAPGEVTDRTLHLDGKKHTVRGESSDRFRGVITVAATGDDVEFEAQALSLPQKACDIIAKLVGDARIGFDDNLFTIQSPGFRGVIPLSANAPLRIKAQLEPWLASQTDFGSFKVTVAEIKSALVDAMSMVGADLKARLVLRLDESADAKFEGMSEAGEIESDFTVIETDLVYEGDLAVPLSAVYLKECLDFYKAEEVVIKVYSQAIAIDLVEGDEHILSQTTMVPLLEAIEAPDGEDGEEKPKPKASKKKTTKKKPEPEEEEEDGEEEAEEEKPKPKASKKKAATKKKPEPEPEEEEDGDGEEEEEETEDEDEGTEDESEEGEAEEEDEDAGEEEEDDGDEDPDEGEEDDDEEEEFDDEDEDED